MNSSSALPFSEQPAPQVQARTADGMREDVLHHDPLLDCLLELTRIHGRSTTRAALVSGLPLAGKKLPPSLFARAAARAGFSAKIVRRPLQKIDPILLPVVLLFKDDEACLLLEWDADGEHARALFPDAGQGGVSISREELEARYSGIAIFARPHFRFDRRVEKVMDSPQEHWFWGAILEQTPVYRDVLLAALLINLFALAMPLFTMNVYDRVVPNFAVDTLWMFAAGLLLVFGIDYALRLLRGYFVDLASLRIDIGLSSKIMEQVLGMRMADRPASVGSFAAILRSFESVRDFIASATVTALIDLPFALIFFLVMLWISWPMVFIPLVGAALVVAYSLILQHRMQELSETTYRASAMRNATLVESLTAFETIKAHGADGIMQSKWEKTAAFLARASGHQRLLASTATNGVATLQQFMTMSMIVLGVYLIHNGMLTMGGLIACTVLAGRALAPLSQMVGLLLQYQTARVSLKSLDGVMSKDRERMNESAFVHRPEMRGEIEFRNVSFNYPGQEEPAVRNVSFKIRQGECVVIIGRVGSGKTTLHKLMLGLYTPSEGAVYVDGVDVRQLDPADLRRNIGYVAQDTMLFYGSLRENIAIGAPFAEDQVIIHAAEKAGLAEFINRHPKGFDMLIGERGDTLSGGQRQGVAIARALLLDPPILLLDEPTSSMDFSSEGQFKEQLRQASAHKTVLIVTHRQSLLDLASRVIVIDGGKVVADGAREQVMEALQSGKVGRAS
jgi:ATP-binding cassette subfamily C protein LapB